MRPFTPVPKPVKQDKPTPKQYQTFVKNKAHAIKKRSTKRAKQEREYARLRLEYLEAHPICEGKLTGCTGKSEVIHHSAGRIGKERLTDVRYFKASCTNCNNRIELYPHEGLESGFYFVGRNK